MFGWVFRSREVKNNLFYTSIIPETMDKKANIKSDK